MSANDPRFVQMKKTFGELKGRLAEKRDQLGREEERRDRMILRYESAKKAQVLVQTVLKEIQEGLQYGIGHLVTLAEAAVFDDPYRFVVRFEPRRGKTECDLLFEKNGQEMAPLKSSGGGAIDIGAMALICSFLVIDGKEPVLIVDEPFHNINDPTRELHKKAAEMLKGISEKLGVQMIIVTGLHEITDVADRVFDVSMGSDGISRVVQRNVS